jgi:hypothetical protein
MGNTRDNPAATSSEQRPRPRGIKRCGRVPRIPTNEDRRPRQGCGSWRFHTHKAPAISHEIFRRVACERKAVCAQAFQLL